MKYILKTNHGASNLPLYWAEKKKQCITSASDATTYDSYEDAALQKKDFNGAIHKRFGEDDPISVKTANKMIILTVPNNSSDIDILSNKEEVDKLFTSFGFSHRGAGNGEWYRQTKHGEVTFGIADSKTMYPYIHVRKGRGEGNTFTTIEELKKYLTNEFNSIAIKSKVPTENDIRLIKRTISKYARDHKLEATELKTVINNIVDDIINEFNSEHDDEFDWNYYR